MWLAAGSLTRELRDGEIVVGSGADADWRVPTADLRPRHFIVLAYGLNATVKPASKNSVIVVNGKQIAGAAHVLRDGDVIAAGSGRFVFSEGPPAVEPAEPAEQEAAFLIDDVGKVAHQIANRSTTIGRDASNSIVLSDPRTSRFHAEIRREAGGFALHSMGSAGTMVNGSVLTAPCMLAEGDIVEIAFIRLRFTRTVPPAMRVADLHDPASVERQRNPTLATGKISVVPSSERTGPSAIVVVIVLALIVAAAVLLMG